jgi:hypothetical protein
MPACWLVLPVSADCCWGRCAGIKMGLITTQSTGHWTTHLCLDIRCDKTLAQQRQVTFPVARPH